MFPAMRSGVLVLALSRVVGLSREFMIALAFGFTGTTDIYYQAVFPITCAIAIMTGPFTTAFAARFAGQPKDQQRAQLWGIEAKIAWVALALIALSLVAAVALYWLPFVDFKQLSVPAAILAPALGAAIFVGYVSAVSTSAGQIALAATGYLSANLAFLFGLVLAWTFVTSPAHWLLPLLYAVGMIFALGPAFAVRAKFRKDLPPTAPVEKKAVAGLGRSFGLAMLESGVFLMTQMVVLLLASAQGAGVASAAALSQRISLSVVGLFVLPFASLVMLRVIKNLQTARRELLRNLGLLVFILLFSCGAAVALISPIAHRFLAPDSAALLISVLPAFALWATPLGINAFLSRVMFGLGLDRGFTGISIGGYVIANVMRVMAVPLGGVTAAVVAGAVVEIALSVVLLRMTLRHLNRVGAPT
jgi:peptidoglycan biosynthesis protein MviN/MurJ (putative lipid II flippase)